MNWRERKPLWAIDCRNGVLLGYNGTTALYSTRRDAAQVIAGQRLIGKCIDARVVKVEVSYREVSSEAGMSKSAIKRVTAQLADEPREKLIEIIVRLEKRIEDLRLVPELVPTSWLDELLTGPKAVLPKVGGTITPKHIELLLNRVKARQCARISDLDREETR